TGDAVAFFKEARDGAFHENVNAEFDAAILERSNEFESGAVADVAETLESVATESTLENVACGSAIEKRAPLFEFADAVGGFRGVELGHAPVVNEFSAAHGVAEMSAPVVGFVDVGHGGGDATFGHDRMRFAKKRFANEADAGPLRDGFDCGAK